MKKFTKAVLSALVMFVMVASSIGGAYADSWKNESNKKYIKAEQKSAQNDKKIIKSLEKLFKDVDDDFWAYQAISDLVKRGIIRGYEDQTFKPNAKVTRSEFATMLTKALKLEDPDDTQTFADVKPSSWDYKAVEASKEFLTGYKAGNGTMYFYGSRDAVREDMAVALVKALDVKVESDNGQLQKVFTDHKAISENLRDYVYTAYKEGIMIGSNKKFDPQSTLTRAEAATLLKRALEKTEKVVVDDSDIDDPEKVVVEDPDEDEDEKSTDATLKSLKYDGITVTAFVYNVFTYNILLPANAEIPTVQAVANDSENASVKITQASDLPGTAKVEVTAEDGTTKKTYTIKFILPTES